MNPFPAKPPAPRTLSAEVLTVALPGDEILDAHKPLRLTGELGRRVDEIFDRFKPRIKQQPNKITI